MEKSAAKKVSAIFVSILLVMVFLLFVFGKVNWAVFFSVAAVSALLAYKVIPKI